VDELQEQQLQGLMQERRKREAALNRALGELLGSGRGAPRAVGAIEDLESLLRSIATFVSSLEA
jgi:hypothetical protein